MFRVNEPYGSFVNNYILTRRTNEKILYKFYDPKRRKIITFSSTFNWSKTFHLVDFAIPLDNLGKNQLSQLGL